MFPEKQATMSIKRKLVDYSSSSDSDPNSKLLNYSSSSDSEAICNYCYRRKKLLSGKKFCITCGKDRIECAKCHRPMEERLMELDGVCRACCAKRNKKTSLMEAAAILDISPEVHDEIEMDPMLYIREAREIARIQTKDKLEQYRGIKWNMLIVVKMSKTNGVGERVVSDFYFHSSPEILMEAELFDEQFVRHSDEMCIKIDEFIKRGSGWQIERVMRLEYHVVPYKPLAPSSYIRTPNFIAKKKATLNIRNDDDMCFVWCILANLFPVKTHKNSVYNYRRHVDKINIENIKFPMTISQISKFERQNPSISVNVFAYDDCDGGYVYPIHVTSFKQRANHIDLLLLTTNEPENISHYVLITNKSRLLASNNRHEHERFYCDYCLYGFNSEERLQNHVKDCERFGPQKVLLPGQEEKWLSFKCVEKQLPVPVVVYADFESFTRKIEGPADPEASINAYELHEPSGYAFYIVWTDNFRPPVFECYHGKNVIERFLTRLSEEYMTIEKVLSQVEQMIITKKQKADHRMAKKCYLCEKPFESEKDKVMDHSHLTGLYRGAAHRTCNLRYKYRGRQTSMPVNSKTVSQQF